tara:strand:+ start:3416 stop:4642 length:1227 start_codon:yes stop_codon:yes gene_type:complete
MSSGKYYIIQENDLNKKQELQIIGKGTYGCVYKPSLFSNSEHYVTKIFTNNDKDISFDCIEEKNSFDYMNKVDPYGLFTIKREIVMFNNKELNEIDLKKAKIEKIDMIDQQKNAYFLNIEYGGEQINTMKEIDFNTFWNKLYNLVNGIASMNKSIVHRDIKETNLLVTKKKFNLIDFGLKISIENVYSKSEKKILSTSYPYYPPEFKLISYLYEKINTYEDLDNLSTELDYFYENSQMDHFNVIMCIICASNKITELFMYCVSNTNTDYSRYNNYYTNNYNKIYYDMYYLLKSFNEFIKKIEKDNFNIYHIIKSFFKGCEKKIDIYSLGITLSFIKYKILKKKLFLSRIETEHYNILDTILYKMTRENVFERIEAEKLLLMIHNIDQTLPKIEDTFPKKCIKKFKKSI